MIARLLTLLPFVCLVGLAAEPKKPNIIFLLADDLGYGDLAVQGSKSIATPHLDRLAAEGVRLEQFYVNAPICSASRASFITGRYPQRWRITSAITARAQNHARGMADFLPESAPTIARLLQQNGYATAHFGKWHLGGGRDVGDAPLVTTYGFDEVLTQFEGLGDRMLPVFSRPMRPRWGEESRHPLGVESAKLGHGKVEFVPRTEMTSRWVDRAIAFVRQSRANGIPFYVNVWPDDPHTPVEPSPDRRGDGSQVTAYKGVVEELDRDLGRLIEFIRNDPELRQNTVIVFASDNGPEINVGSSGSFRGEKTNIYEGGIRVPFIVWAPGLLPKPRVGVTDRTTVMAGMDLPPTLLALAGVSSPRSKFDGQDMTAALFTGAATPPRTLFWSRPPDHTGANKEMPDVAARRDSWKVLVHDNGQPDELYNLAVDPTESQNLAGKSPEVLQDLKAAIAAWRSDVGATIIGK